MGSIQVYLCSVLILISVLVSVKAECECDVPIKHYEELGCEAVFAKPDDCCPSHYNCDKVTSRAADNDKCYFKGKEYNKRETVDSELSVGNCMAACFCNKNEWSDFTCAHIDCPEFLGGKVLEPGCIRLYEHNGCCSSGNACPPFENLAKCEVNGKTYYEGQRFEAPKGNCLNCLCQKGFEGKFIEPFCKPVNCGVELAHAAKARKNCAPVYYGTGRCCPIHWECPSDTDTTTNKPGVSKSEKTCSFGDQIMKIGEKFDPKRDSKYSPEINCECKIPPLVTCIQKPNES